jgi:hypothetical protein
VLHQGEAFLAQHFVLRDLARYIGDRRTGPGGSGGPFRVAAAGAPRVTGLRDLVAHDLLPELGFQYGHCGAGRLISLRHGFVTTRQFPPSDAPLGPHP